MKFYTNEIEQIDRHTEPKIEDLPIDSTVPAKYEEITLTVKLTGSGDTRRFTSDEIISIIMNRISLIEPNAT